MNYMECHVNNCKSMKRHRNCIFDRDCLYHEFEIPFHVYLNPKESLIKVPIPIVISKMMEAYEGDGAPLLINLNKMKLRSESSLTDCVPVFAKAAQCFDIFNYPWRNSKLSEVSTPCSGNILGTLIEELIPNQDGKNVKINLKLDENFHLKTKKSYIALQSFQRKDNYQQISISFEKLNRENEFLPLLVNKEINCFGSLLILIPKSL